LNIVKKSHVIAKGTLNIAPLRETLPQERSGTVLHIT